MPVRSLSSSVLRWPDRETVDGAVRRWAEDTAKIADVRRIGYFGSYARGDWGVGSDLDLVVILETSSERASLDATTLPVPADLFVYMEQEWEALGKRFRETLERETVWVYPAKP